MDLRTLCFSCQLYRLSIIYDGHILTIRSTIQKKKKAYYSYFENQHYELRYLMMYKNLFR